MKQNSLGLGQTAKRTRRREFLDEMEKVGSWADLVEHPFRVVKRQFGYVKVRYRGLAKNTAQLHTLFALSNLWMARKKLELLMGKIRRQMASAA